MEACRACLTTEDNMVPLDEVFVNDYNTLTNLNVALLDAMPQFVCSNCLQSVKFCIDFRERCITTETSLQEVLLKKEKFEDDKPLSELVTNSSNTDIKIKKEPREEDSEGLAFDDTFTEFDGDTSLCLKKEDIEEYLPKKKKHKRGKYKKHKIKEEFDVNKLLCGLCSATYSNKQELSTHVESHRGDKKCGLCSETFHYWPTLVGHRLTHLPTVKQKKCHMCKRIGHSSVQLEYHYMSTHFDGEKHKLKCKHCSRSYDTLRKLRKHVSGTHSKNCFVCDYCSKLYNNKQGLKSHIKSHLDKRTFVCEECGFASKQSSGLREHKLWKHTPTKAKCYDCERIFPTPEDRDRHKCTNVAKICPVCGVQIAKNKNFNRHMKQHEAIGRYKCTRCPKIYKSKNALTAHLNKHDGIRPLQCEYCPLKFYTASVLVKHRRVHTGEKPYVCKVCRKGFTGNHNLKVHMKVHGEYLVVKKSKPDDEFLAPPPAIPLTMFYPAPVTIEDNSSIELD